MKDQMLQLPQKGHYFTLSPNSMFCTERRDHYIGQTFVMKHRPVVVRSRVVKPGMFGGHAVGNILPGIGCSRTMVHTWLHLEEMIQDAEAGAIHCANRDSSVPPDQDIT